MTRLTTEALDALLSEHERYDEDSPQCLCGERWPCATYLLASEVRDARAIVATPKKCPGCAVDVPAPLEEHLPECSVRQWHEAMDGVEDSDDD